MLFWGSNVNPPPGSPPRPPSPLLPEPVLQGGLWLRLRPARRVRGLLELFDSTALDLGRGLLWRGWARAARCACAVAAILHLQVQNCLSPCGFKNCASLSSPSLSSQKVCAHPIDSGNESFAAHKVLPLSAVSVRKRPATGNACVPTVSGTRVFQHWPLLW